MKIAVVGSGLIGLATAYSLARRGAEVVVVGDRVAGSGASSNNAGWVVPAESGPLPGPGVILQTLRWMLKPDSPVYVRPSASPSFVRFMIGMLRACNATAYWRAFEATAHLAAGTMDEFDAWVAEGLTFEMHADGEIRAYLDAAELRHAVDSLAAYERVGFEAAALTGDEARTLVPDLSDGVVGGIHFPAERHVRPTTLVSALANRLGALGVRFADGAVTAAWALPAGGVELRGGFGSERADALVIAAGAWSARVARLLGVALPIRPGKGYSVDYVPGQLASRPVISLSEAHCVITPLDGATRVAGTMEFGGLDERISKVRLAAIRRAPGRYLRNWDPDAPSLAPSAGLRPMTPDGLPVIGRLRPFASVYVASGHAMLGLTLAPRTGSLLADMILDGADPEILAPFSPRRFGA
jgi:D-amino-acid dehydrogenase